jgi:hypothetical protein
VSREITSAESQFKGNVATSGDGGAVFIMNSFDATGSWNSSRDHFENNMAKKGSGGAIAAMGTHVSLDNTACQRNHAPAGGGGCIFWEPLATTMAGEDVWQSLSPVSTAESQVLIEQENQAGYGTTFGSGAASLRVKSGNSRNFATAAPGGASLTPSPRIEILDFSGSVMKGIKLDGVIVTAHLTNTGASPLSSSTRIFGGTSSTVDVHSGVATFSALGLRSAPGSGPHNITFKAALSLSKINREITTQQPLVAWVDMCTESTFKHGDSCSSCPLNAHFVSNQGPVQNACSCNVDYFREMAADETMTCTKCPPRSSSPKGSIGVTSCVCNQGTFSDGGECKTCPVNSQNAPSGRSVGPVDKACACIENYYSEITGGEMACTKCPPRSSSPKGSIGVTSCECNQGTFSDGGECKTCPVNSQNAPSGRSVGPVEKACACIENYYSEITGGEMTCVKCPIGKVAPAGSRKCLCEKDKFYTTNVMNQTCKACQIGADCSRKNGIVLEELSARPGFWRPNPDSEHFVDCSKAVGGNKALAELRCCPSTTCLNISTSSNFSVSPTNRDLQCEKGYEGIMCACCEKGYARVAGDCVPCATQGTLGLGFAVLGSFGGVIFITFFAYLKCSKTIDVGTHKASAVFGQIKILIAFLQILSSFPSVMSSVPFPDSFLSFAWPIGYINFDVLGFLEFSHCSLSLHFFDMTILHLVSLPYFFFCALLAYLGANCTAKSKSKDARNHRRAQMYKFFIISTVLLYPGLATRLFTLFDCKQVKGIEGKRFLYADWSIVCGEGQHNGMMVLGISCICLYIVGIPLTVSTLLYRNRKALHDESHPRHKNLLFEFGGLYSQVCTR